jgi:hypothetical protein
MVLETSVILYGLTQLMAGQGLVTQQNNLFHWDCPKQRSEVDANWIGRGNGLVSQLLSSDLAVG